MAEDYCFIETPRGDVLAVQDGKLATATTADDRAMWVRDGTRLRSAVGGITLQLNDSRSGIESGADLPGGLTANDALTLRDGPRMLPSEHLADIRANGFTVLENVLDAAAIARCKTDIAAERARHFPDEEVDGRFNIGGGMMWCPDTLRSASHPVALWVLRSYLGTHDIHLCHQPATTILKPAKDLLGEHPPGGWHADYPYHPGVFPGDDWPATDVYGVQYNVCVDAFTAENGATQYLPGSHKLCERPSAEFNANGTTMGKGIFRNVAQMLAPAGAALIYDARTWHRPCPELNVSGTDRIAFLNAVAPAYVIPMGPKSEQGKAYRESDVPSLLTEREREDIEALCLRPMQETPTGKVALLRRTA